MKNNEITVGDVVRVSKDAPRMYVSGADSIGIGANCKVMGIEDDNAIIKADEWLIAIPTKYLIKVGKAKEAEPKIKEGDKVRYIVEGICGIVSKCDNTCYVIELKNGMCCYTHRDNIELVQTREQMEADAKNMAKHCEIPDVPDHKTEIQPIIIPVEVDIQDSYWKAYTADLAGEIAIAYAEKGRFEPKDIGVNAVIAAKAVVEELKKK